MAPEVRTVRSSRQPQQRTRKKRCSTARTRRSCRRLGEDMNRLKREAAHLRDDVREHNALIDRLGLGFQGASDGVRRTVVNLDAVMKRYGYRQMCALALGIFLLILLCYHVGKAAFSRKSAT